MKTPFSILTLVSFLVTAVIGPIPPISLAQTQIVSSEDWDLRLPVPGVMVHLSSPLDPPILKGIKVHPDNPFRFEFILDKGDSPLSNDLLKDESSKLIKYFLASLTIPERDLWVNLSPYEKDRIVPQSFGLTEMGRDLLAEDYMLKQITASLIYPEGEVGKKFWKKIYEEAQKKFGTTNIPVNTFNKVWIVPDTAVVYENAQAGTAYVVESKLKVMLEEDYLSLSKHRVSPSAALGSTSLNLFHSIGANVVREIVIPQLTKEVNEGRNFSQLRQVYNSLILATWYKKKIKDSILEQAYADKNKIAGVGYKNASIEDIYQRYLQAFKKGVFNYIKEQPDPITQGSIPRKYFSGGVWLSSKVMLVAMKYTNQAPEKLDHAMRVTVDMAVENPAGVIDQAMGIENAMKRPSAQRMQFAMLRAENAIKDFLADAKIQREPLKRQIYSTARMIMAYEDATNAGLPSAQTIDPVFLKNLVKKHEYEMIMTSTPPNDQQKKWIQEAANMLKDMCKEWGIPFQDFSNFVRITRFKNEEDSSTDGAISASGIIIIDERHDKETFLTSLVHEGIHFLSKGFDQEFLNEGTTQYLTILTLKKHGIFPEESFNPDRTPKVMPGFSENEVKEFMKRRIGPASAFTINSWLEKGASIYLSEVAVIEELFKSILPKYHLSESDWLKAFFYGDYNALLKGVFSTRGNDFLLMVEETNSAITNEFLKAVGDRRYLVKSQMKLKEIELYTKSIGMLFEKINRERLEKMKQFFGSQDLRVEQFDPSYSGESPAAFNSSIMEKQNVTQNDIIDYLQRQLVDGQIEKINKNPRYNLQDYLDSIGKAYRNMRNNDQGHARIVSQLNSELEDETPISLKMHYYSSISGIYPYFWVHLQANDVDSDGNIISMEKKQLIEDLMNKSKKSEIEGLQKIYTDHFKRYFYSTQEGVLYALGRMRRAGNTEAQRFLQIGRDMRKDEADQILQERLLFELQNKGIIDMRGRLKNIFNTSLKDLSTALQTGANLSSDQVLTSAKLFFASQYLLENMDRAMSAGETPGQEQQWLQTINEITLKAYEAAKPKVPKNMMAKGEIYEIGSCYYVNAELVPLLREWAEQHGGQISLKLIEYKSPNDKNFHQFLIIYYMDRFWVVDPTWQQVLLKPARQGKPKVLIAELKELPSVLKQLDVPLESRKYWREGLSRYQEYINNTISLMPGYTDFKLEDLADRAMLDQIPLILNEIEKSEGQTKTNAVFELAKLFSQYKKYDFLLAQAIYETGSLKILFDALGKPGGASYKGQFLIMEILAAIVKAIFQEMQQKDIQEVIDVLYRFHKDINTSDFAIMNIESLLDYLKDPYPFLEQYNKDLPHEYLLPTERKSKKVVLAVADHFLDNDHGYRVLSVMLTTIFGKTVNLLGKPAMTEIKRNLQKGHSLTESVTMVLENKFRLDMTGISLELSDPSVVQRQEDFVKRIVSKYKSSTIVFSFSINRFFMTSVKFNGLISPELLRDISKDNEVVFFFSAGNRKGLAKRTKLYQYPIFDNVIHVAATRARGLSNTLALYSVLNSHTIFSVPALSLDGDVGTSFSAPVAAGMAVNALIKDKNVSVKAVLEQMKLSAKGDVKGGGKLIYPDWWKGEPHNGIQKKRNPAMMVVKTMRGLEDRAMNIPMTLRVKGEVLNMVPLTRELLLRKKEGFFGLLNLIAADQQWQMGKHIENMEEGPEKAFDSRLSFAVLNEKQDPVAMAIVGKSQSNEGYVYLKYYSVDASYRGTVVASWLLLKSFEQSQIRGYQGAHWVTTALGSEAAVRFYEKIGGLLDKERFENGIIPPNPSRDFPKQHLALIYSFSHGLPILQGIFAQKMKDNAQISNLKVEKGGIDLTSANMNLKMQNAGAGIKFHIDPAMLQQLQNASGFVPVIINIEPLGDLRTFLGLKEQKSIQSG